MTSREIKVEIIIIFDASQSIDGPMNGNAFLAYVEQVLAPSLTPGDIIVMDNLAAHKMSGVGEAIKGLGAGLLPAAYSPDFKPIEQSSPSSRP